MLELIVAAGIMMPILARSASVFSQPPYQHPSLRPRQFEFVLQPEPSRHAYRGPTAIRTKTNRHNRKRNKA